MLASARDPSLASDKSEMRDDKVELVVGDSDARGGWEVVRYGSIDNWIEEGDVDGWTGRWSDHRAVRVTIERS